MQHLNPTAQYTLPNQILNDNASNWSDLHDAAASGDEKRLQALLSANIDRMCKESKHGNTPLHEAAWRGFSRCVKLLCTPPKIEHKAKKLKKTVVETRANSLLSSILGIRNDEGFSALHLAAQNGHNQSCRELLLAGADPDVQNFYGDAALHTACRYGHAGATRIILSAQCDANKANLNGDTALHISCAMGRRKLTRILLEADCNVLCTNAQNETPRDIATRKRYKEILEILDNPRPQKSRKKKHRDKNANNNDDDRSVSPTKEINWSPYGCHYYPDPRNFPHPKLETLPKEPLKPGEQYYLDLAGRIHKGPIGVGNTCYCGSFFRHIEDKISCNQKNLIKYVHKAKHSMGQKVQALALRTNDQIEQLTRTMIEERARCESRRFYIDRCLRRGEPIRLTADYQLKSKRKYDTEDGTLVRCRSMDFLDENTQGRKVQASRSCDLLDDSLVTIHQQNEVHNDGGESSATELSLSHIRKAIDEPDMESLTRRLGDLLAKTKLLTERDFENDHNDDRLDLPNHPNGNSHEDEDVEENEEEEQNQNDDDDDGEESESDSSLVDSPSHFNDTVKPNPKRQSHFSNEIEQKDSNPLNAEQGIVSQKSVLPVSYANETLFQSYKPIYTAVNHLFGRRKSRSALSETSNQSQHSSIHDLQSLNDPTIPQQYLPDNHAFQNVLKALSKDRLNQDSYTEQESLNQNEHIAENKLSYKLEHINDIINNGVNKKDLEARELQQQGSNPSFQESNHNNSLPPTVRGLAANFERSLNLTQAIIHQIPENETYSNQMPIPPAPQSSSSNAPSINGRLEKLEIKNCAIKTLKTKTSTSSNFKTKVQNLVERFQNSSSSKQNKATLPIPPAIPPPILTEPPDSESSEDDQNYHNERLTNNPYPLPPNGEPLQPPPTLPRNLPYLPARNVIPLNTRPLSSPLLSSTASSISTAQPLLQNVNQRIAYQPPPTQRVVQNYQSFPERVIPKDAYFHKLPNKPKTHNYQNASELDLNSMAGPQAVSNASYQSMQQFRLSQLQQVQYPPTNMNLSPSGSSYTSIPDHNLVNNVGLPQPIESTLYRQSPANIYRYHSNPVDHTIGKTHSIPSNVSPMQTTPPSIERDMLSNDSGFSTRIYYES